MQRGLTTDFKVAAHEITVLLDSRLADFSPPLATDHIVQVSQSESSAKIMAEVAREMDAVFIVAPEANQTLKKLVELVEAASLCSLNSSPAAIDQAADKTTLPIRLKSLGLKGPKTLTFATNEPVEYVARTVKTEFGFPSIFKPSNGAGCSAMSIVQSEAEVFQAIEKIKMESSDKVIVQEFIEGASSSVSLIVADNKALPITLNLQDITLAHPEGVSSYNGGLVPFEHPLKDEAFEAAKRISESFGGLRGYVGVDLVLAEDQVFVVEVNPRLTTSYVGLRRVADFNIAEAITDAATKKALPESSHPIGVSCFSKVPVSRPVIFAWQEFLQMEELTSPPFPVPNEETCYAMLQSYGDTTENALRNLSEAKKHLQDVWLRGQHPW